MKERNVEQLFEFECTMEGDEYSHTIIERSRSAARYAYFMYLDCYDEYYPSFANHCKVKKIGPAKPSSYFGDYRSFVEMKKARQIPFAFQGMDIEVCGKHGIIVGSNASQNLDVLFGNAVHNCHPWFEAVYYDQKGGIVADYRDAGNRKEEGNGKKNWNYDQESYTMDS
jgi:hypothetical protein